MEPAATRNTHRGRPREGRESRDGRDARDPQDPRIDPSGATAAYGATRSYRTTSVPLDDGHRGSVHDTMSKYLPPVDEDYYLAGSPDEPRTELIPVYRDPVRPGTSPGGSTCPRPGGPTTTATGARPVAPLSPS
ncbi:hypothetical protein [Arsenicicoccus dermatophilus]|uniref:hypothetical protein n=1 Tax=Arsenicicoccus dermatophilus TaxID=1076331 RepID=UPI001F4C95B8|nr:hypothetical protein [Arsenicicoccus dermatophilus]MCH8612176.1 hypothetical protein [Arsenicicoccus dermatophilus]